MSESAGKAVFLSYASQDVGAALRISTALRAAGVEVWLDQEGGLVGGDVWDRKIREQIAACALFVTVISANTQARKEGYFRLEWKLAAQRTHMMSERTAFLLPVVIDATRDADADVPAEFRAVQWTRLRPAGRDYGGQALDEPSLAAFCERVKTLLGPPGVAGVADPGNSATGLPARQVPAAARPATPPLSRPWFIPAVVAVLALAALALWQPWKAKAPPASNPSPIHSSSSPVATLATAAVAVLAFTNLSDDKGNEYFSDGISEELLNVLAKVPGLQVAARTSAFHFKGKDTPIPEIARQLGVAFVVEGSVRKAGTQLRISARLVNAADGKQVWGDDFREELKDVFALQDKIAGLIAQQLSLKLGVSAPAATVNPEAFNLYLEGLAVWNQRSGPRLNQAVELFAKALALDPSFARAHAVLADTRYLIALNAGLDTEEARPHLDLAQKGVERALALDPALGDAYATRATLLHYKHQDAAADADFQRALSHSPNSAFIRQRRGAALWARGKLPAAFAELQLSVRLDPLSAINLSMLGAALGSVRRWEEALAAHEKALAIDPNFVRARSGCMECLFNLGRQAEALEMARLVADDTSTGSSFAARALALSVRAGDTAAIERAKQALAQPAPFDARSGRNRVALYLALNRLEEALAAFETARPDDIRSAANLNHPQFDPIRNDPRFLRKVEKDGLLADYREAWSHVPEAEKQKAARR